MEKKLQKTKYYQSLFRIAPSRQTGNASQSKSHDRLSLLDYFRMKRSIIKVIFLTPQRNAALHSEVSEMPTQKVKIAFAVTSYRGPFHQKGRNSSSLSGTTWTLPLSTRINNAVAHARIAREAFIDCSVKTLFQPNAPHPIMINAHSHRMNFVNGQGLDEVVFVTNCL